MSEYLIKEENLVELANIIREKRGFIDDDVSFVENRESYNIHNLPESLTSIGDYAFFSCSNLALTFLPEGITSIGEHAFFSCYNLALTSLPEGITNIGNSAFGACINLKSITFKGTPTTIHSYAFGGCSNITTINVPWSEGEVANAPWGATNATINYNYVEVA
jgi:hypothetical protein